MINIQLNKPVKLKQEKQSIFIGFDFSFNRVAKVKSLDTRYYNPQLKKWEVPVNDINKVIELFSDEEIEIKTSNTCISVPDKQKQGFKAEIPEVDVSAFNFKTKPFNHQIEAFKYATKNSKFLLGDEQGLGKTKQAIDIAVSRKKEMKHCLIICGVNSLKFNWANEIKVHSEESSHILGTFYNTKGKLKEGTVKNRLEDLQDIEEFRDCFFLITNIETLRLPKKKKRYSEREQAQIELVKTLNQLTNDGTIGMVIIDEIHKAKNPQSQQGKAIQELSSKYKLALTGTPLMNQPLDLFNVLKWLEVEKSNFFQFKKRYCVMGGFGGYEIVGYRNLGELKDKLNNTMLRRKKDEVLDLPPKIRSVDYVEMTGKQKQLYTEIKREIKSKLTEIEMDPNPLAQLIRLRQVTGHPAILSDQVRESAKIERLKEIIEELHQNGQKCIVFSNWTNITKEVQKELQPYNPAIITGDTKDREHEVSRFQNDDNCSVIIGTIGAMGTGLTLTAASTVIFLDKPWNMANTEQAEDRAHRIGTKYPVNIITLCVKDSIDERIESIISEKGEMAEALVDGNIDKVSKGELLNALLG